MSLLTVLPGNVLPSGAPSSLGCVRCESGAARPAAARRISREARLLNHLLCDLPARRQLPREQAEGERVECDVSRARAVAPLGHERDEGGGHRPGDDDARSRVEVRAGEELLRTQEGVDRALDGEGRAEAQDDRADLVVLLAQVV